jgi:hypothetical protein
MQGAFDNASEVGQEGSRLRGSFVAPTQRPLGPVAAVMQFLVHVAEAQARLLHLRPRRILGRLHRMGQFAAIIPAVLQAMVNATCECECMGVMPCRHAWQL